MKWSEKTWKSSESVYKQIEQLPFLKELMNGTLPRQKFLFYLEQDAIYLKEYCKILAAIASKLDRNDHREALLSFSNDTIVVETAMHKLYLSEHKPTTLPTPSCLLYTGHLWQQFGGGSVETALAAVLPCFWVYYEVGKFIVANQTKGANPYQDWINTYEGDEFAKSVETAINICDDLAAASNEKVQEAMTRAFQVSCKLEWLFWDSAWKLELKL